MAEEPVATLDYSTPQPERSWGRRVLGILAIPEVGVLIPLVLLICLFQSIAPAFLTRDSISPMLKALAFIGIIAIGEAMLLVAGELDLGVGSVAGLCSTVAGALMAVHHWSLVPALMVSISVGATVGLVNGLITCWVGVPAFIATLGMLWIAEGVNYLICHGVPRSEHLSPALLRFGDAEPLGISWAFWVFIITATLGEVVMRFTTFGRRIYATGGNAEVARIAGINTRLVKLSCFIITGVLSAVAGILVMAQFAVAQPETGKGWELFVIAGVVMGGISLFGGSGSVLGAFFGLLLMQVIQSGLTMAGGMMDPNVQKIALGAILIAAVAFDVLRRRIKLLRALHMLAKLVHPAFGRD